MLPMQTRVVLTDASMSHGGGRGNSRKFVILKPFTYINVLVDQAVSLIPSSQICSSHHLWRGSLPLWRLKPQPKNPVLYPTQNSATRQGDVFQVGWCLELCWSSHPISWCCFFGSPHMPWLQKGAVGRSGLENQLCHPCGGFPQNNPVAQWASVSFGILLCGLP